MQQNSGFSMQDAARLMRSPEGKQLLQLLQQDGGAAMRQAAAALSAGNPEQAKSILGPMVGTPEVAALLEKLDGRR